MTNDDVDLDRFEAAPIVPARHSLDPVNPAMIRHWCTAIGDTNPRYAVGEDQVAPPTMLQAWCMPGLPPEGVGADVGDGEPSALDELLGSLADLGYDGVVATDCEQTYERELRPGDVLTEERMIETISPRKMTALGPGYFVTVRSRFTDADDREVASMRFCTLRYRPDTDVTARGSSGSRPDPALRPRPAITHDNAFFFRGARESRLLIQRCDECEVLVHPPSPRCPSCGSFDHSPAPMTGRGVVHTFVVSHHPQVDGFDYPLVVAVVELDEGVRLVSELVDVHPAGVSIGLEVEVEFLAVDEELTLPVFRPVES